MDLLTFQNEADKVIAASAAECEQSQLNGEFDRLSAIEDKLARMIQSGSSLPSEPAVLDSLRIELKRVRQVKNGLVAFQS